MIKSLQIRLSMYTLKSYLVAVRFELVGWPILTVLRSRQIPKFRPPPPYVTLFDNFIIQGWSCHTLLPPTPLKRYVTFELPLTL